MSDIYSRLEASIQQAKLEIQYNTYLEIHGEPDMKSIYKQQLIDWTERLANLIWIQSGEIIGTYHPVYVE
ncbi:hypothetical protein [Spirosoma litoris]